MPAAMTDELIQPLAIGVIASLLALELVLALMSWVEARGGAGTTRRTAILVTQPFAIRSHFKARQAQINALRRDYLALRSPGHGHDVRRTIRSLQPTRFTALAMDCSACRGSRMRGLSRCPDCQRPLLAPAHGASA
jgi:hypothetical protein